MRAQMLVEAYARLAVEQNTAELKAEVERLRAALKTAKWMLERDYIDDQKMAVIRKCEAALGEPK
jgi:predicted urease superfamily metal-dependent hydrolase